jgi:hypothetical protein
VWGYTLPLGNAPSRCPFRSAVSLLAFTAGWYLTKNVLAPSEISLSGETRRRSAIIKVYSSLWSRSNARENCTADQHDASAVAWLRLADLDGSLAGFLGPSSHIPKVRLSRSRAGFSVSCDFIIWWVMPAAKAK